MGAFELSVVFWQETLERGSNPTDVTQFEKRLRHLIREKFLPQVMRRGTIQTMHIKEEGAGIGLCVELVKA